MTLPIEDLTPRQIVAQLDQYIVGQSAAKKAVAVALRNRYRRQQLPPEERDDVLPKNILMIGPTGVGKTEIARRLAQLAKAPFVKVEATKFTEVGYVGRDVESMIRDLVSAAVRLVTQEYIDAVKPQASVRAEERLVDLLVQRIPPAPTETDESEPEKTPDPAAERPSPAESTAEREMREALMENPIFRQAFEIFGSKLQDGYPESWTPGTAKAKSSASDEQASARHREEIRARLRRGELENERVQVEVEEATNPFIQVFSPQGLEEMGLDPSNLGGPFGARQATREVTVAEARKILTEEESRRMIDKSAMNREAIERAEQTGIVFLDELDKVAGRSGGSGPDVSREGVQRDLLPIIEGSTVATKFGQIRTDHILFIAAGAFHISKPSDLIPELQGRLPIRVELEPLTEDDFRRILSEPRNALVEQYRKLLAVEGVTLEFTDEAVAEIAKIAAEVNARTENIGARRLHTVMERLLEDVLFDAPDVEQKHIRFGPEEVRQRLSTLAGDVDLSRYIL
ncbi:MAG: ATP-dependent protease ATPase subunit HslU [Fimbriimonadaceae bacterium]